MSSSPIPFNRPYATGRELGYIQQAIESHELSGSGSFGKRCEAWLAESLNAGAAMLTPSGTAALEFAALLANICPGDEVIMPSFTFPSTATAFVLRGATPVFVDIRADTLNIDEALVEEAITPETAAIVAVHYAGVSAEMDALRVICERYGLVLIEDAAQAIGSTYHGRPVGGDGHYAAFSFHETKNVMCGEGGALLVNVPGAVERAEIIREKGTDRSGFFRGEIDRYTWRAVGSSFLLGELSAAFLWAQLEAADEILLDRVLIWEAYDSAFEVLKTEGLVRRPIVPEHCTHNGHLYYLLLPDEDDRDRLIGILRPQGIMALSHYEPLHTSQAGEHFGRVSGELPVTESVSRRLLRLPLWIGMGEAEIERVVRAVAS